MATDPGPPDRHALPGFAAGSYRADPDVPAFPEDRPLIVFDGVCVLCSGFAQFVMARDVEGEFLFTHAQSAVGQALFVHYGLDPEDFETNLLVENGLAYGGLDAMALIMRRFGPPWRWATLFLRLPRPLTGWLYLRIARNRYSLFGRRETCWLPSESLRQRMIG